MDKCPTISSKDVPLIVFFTTCFFLVLAFLLIKIKYYSIPSAFTLSIQSICLMTSCVILFCIGMISITIEWFSAILFILMIVFVMIALLDPVLFFYDTRTSEDVAPYEVV